MITGRPNAVGNSHTIQPGLTKFILTTTKAVTVAMYAPIMFPICASIFRLRTSFNFSSPDGSLTLDFIMIDTIELSDLSSASYKQFDWIEQELNKSYSNNALYTIVAGHYPVYSICKHGNTPSLVKYLEPLLKKYNAIYLSGHDHCQEYLVNDGINYIVSGMGKECCYESSNLNNPVQEVVWYFASESQKGQYSNVVGGFALLSANNMSLHITFYDQDGNILYVTPQIKPRNCEVNCTNSFVDIRNDSVRYSRSQHSYTNMLVISIITFACSYFMTFVL